MDYNTVPIDIDTAISSVHEGYNMGPEEDF